MGLFAHSSSPASGRGSAIAIALISLALWPRSAWAQADITDADGDGIIESGEPVRFEANETHLGHPCYAYTWELFDLDGLRVFESDQRVIGWVYVLPGVYGAELTRSCEGGDPNTEVHVFAPFQYEVEEAAPEDDFDGDGIGDAVDNCVTFANPEQDGSDLDVDDIPDACDNCILSANPSQSNCDPQWDQDNPVGMQGDACDPDPCTAWQTHAGGSVLQPSSVALGNGDIEEGGSALFTFDAMGGWMDGTFTFPADGTGNEYAVDVASRYCSCRHADGGECGEVYCRQDGVQSGNLVTGEGWLVMTRSVGGDNRREPIPDVTFRRGGGSVGTHSWEWQGNECPAAVEGAPQVACGALAEGDQRFRLWLRPLVDDTIWFTGWPSDEHNFYNADEESMSVRILTEPADELPWPGWPFIPEGPCHECSMEFFGEDLLPMLREFDPDEPLPSESPYRFTSATSGDAIEGLGVALLDAASLAPVAFVPSQGVTGWDDPKVTRSLACIAPTAGEAELWLFGGLDGTGTPSTKLFHGVTDSPAQFTWTREAPSGSIPPGRTDGLLAFDPVTEMLVLYAGKSGTATLDDLWRFDPVSGSWESAEFVHFGGDSPDARHSFAHAQSDAVVYLYGGKGPSGSFLGDLYELDLATLTVRELTQDLTGGGPGARASAGMAVEVGGRSILLYGGTTSSGNASDLWRYDLATGRWSRVSRPCTGGPCPPAGDATLLAGPTIGSALLPAAISTEPHPEPYWHFEAGRAAVVPGWISAGSWRRSADSKDCNGNGVADSGVGYACATSAQWYAAPSARACDRVGTQLACPAITTSSTGTTSFAAATPAAFAARDGIAVLATGTSVKRIKLVAGQTPSVIATATLTGTARSVVLDGSLAFVGTSVGVEVFSLAGTSLVKVAQKTLSGGANAMAGDGVRLYVAQGMTFRVYDAATSSLPQLGSVTLPLTTTPTTATVAGTRVLVAGGTKVAVVSVVTPSSPVVLATPTMSGTTSALRARNRVGYGVLTTGSTYVLDVTGSPVLSGTHDVTTWARGAVYLTSFALRINGANLEVAGLVP